MKEAKYRLYKKGKDLNYESKYCKALKWLFILLYIFLGQMLPQLQIKFLRCFGGKDKELIRTPLIREDIIQVIISLLFIQKIEMNFLVAIN